MTNLPKSSGPCCACGENKPDVRNWVLLPVKALISGRGWGCMACRLPRDGAIAILCNLCFSSGKEIVWTCASFPADPARVPLSELMGEHIHDLKNHPELQGKEPADG